MNELLTETTTKARRIFLDLRSRILSGAIPADTRLTLRPLAKRYGTGINAVSEAVKALAAEGLVEPGGQAGARVIARDLQRIRGEHVLRIAIECEAARRLAAIADDAHYAVLGRMARDLDALADGGEQLLRCHELDVKFHLTVAEFSGVSQLRETLRPLLERLVMLDQTEAQSAEFPGQKHLELFAALNTRDPEKAAAGMRQHCEHSMNLSLAMLYG